MAFSRASISILFESDIWWNEPCMESVELSSSSSSTSLTFPRTEPSFAISLSMLGRDGRCCRAEWRARPKTVEEVIDAGTAFSGSSCPTE